VTFFLRHSVYILLLGRSTYMSADLYFTADSFSFLFSFFLLFSPSNFRAHWTELNQNRPMAIWQPISSEPNAI